MARGLRDDRGPWPDHSVPTTCGPRSPRCCGPRHPSPRAAGRAPDRAGLTGIVFVLRSGIPWGLLPRELGGGSGMTCWRRLLGRPRGRPRTRPAERHADKASGFRRVRAARRARGIVPQIARRGVESGERLGRHRWLVEPTPAWRPRDRRLRVRDERRADLHRAFLTLGGALIGFNHRP